jgi:endonuclease YncB( thermonuclease family)
MRSSGPQSQIRSVCPQERRDDVDSHQADNCLGGCVRGSVRLPNVKYVDRFRAVSDSAKEARVGLWSGSAFECLPADSRAGRC